GREPARWRRRRVVRRRPPAGRRVASARVEARDYRDGDLRAMQRLVQDAWALVGAKNERHVGDVAWADSQLPDREHTFRRRLWWDGDRVAAWGWLFLPATLGWQLDPRRPELLHDVLDWFEK